MATNFFNFQDIPDSLEMAKEIADTSCRSDSEINENAHGSVGRNNV